MTWGAIKNFLLDLLFPPRCALCGALVDSSAVALCPRCEKGPPEREDSPAEGEPAGAVASGAGHTPRLAPGGIRGQIKPSQKEEQRL